MCHPVYEAVVVAIPVFFGLLNGLRSSGEIEYALHILKGFGLLRMVGEVDI